MFGHAKTIKLKLIAINNKLLLYSYTVFHLDSPGDIKSQATPTEAHSVIESRPAMSEPASHSLHHTTSTTTTSKTSLTTGIGKNALALSTQPIIGASTYIKHTTSTAPHLSSASRFVLLCVNFI